MWIDKNKNDHVEEFLKWNKMEVTLFFKLFSSKKFKKKFFKTLLCREEGVFLFFLTFLRVGG